MLKKWLLVTLGLLFAAFAYAKGEAPAATRFVFTGLQRPTTTVPTEAIKFTGVHRGTVVSSPAVTAPPQNKK